MDRIRHRLKVDKIRVTAISSCGVPSMAERVALDPGGPTGLVQGLGAERRLRHRLKIVSDDRQILQLDAV